MNSLNEEKENLVAVSTTKLVFPEQCPVCGNPATALSIIAKSVQSPLRSRRWSWWGRTRFPLPVRNIRRIEVPVCDQHRTSLHEKGRLMTLLGVVNGLSIVFSLFLGSAIAFYLHDGFSVDLSLNLLFLASFFTMIGSFRALGPSALEKAISIIRFDTASQAAILRMKHETYLEELLRLNPTTTRRPRVTSIGDTGS
jgi:hypothetical protein